MEFANVTPETQEILTASTVEMAVLKQTVVYLPHLFSVYCMKAGRLGVIVRQQNITIEGLREVVGELYPSVDISFPADKFDATVLDVVERASEWAKNDGGNALRLVRPDHLFIMMLEMEDEDLMHVLHHFGADPVFMMHEALVLRGDLDRHRPLG